MPPPPSSLQFSYPENLPVSRRRVELMDAIREHQVVIVCGDTGSGKTTQLPKMIAEVTANEPGVIGITQPRRLAATQMARRVAEECRVELGQEVGVQIRFRKISRDDTRILFMTDGLLLAQSSADPEWRRYSALMIDEAHERSLNIDFLLGCLHRLLPRRPDLKVVISSATLDAARFSSFFHRAPIVEVEGKLHPIEEVYLPPDPDRDQALPDQVIQALSELDRRHPELDTLVFLPGEREIRETADKLAPRFRDRAEILPLYARLGSRDQERVFSSGNRRRIILATNVAETSLTLPGIRAVIDTGYARLQRYHPQSRIQRLVTEPISRASARQRRGRCGRTAPGVCVRLYAEDALEQAPAYTDPEIRRSSLAEVILRMAVLGLPPLNEFPLLDPPKGAAINDGYRTLIDIGAMTPRRKLTARGRRLASFSIDPQIARMLEEGEQEKVLPAVIVLAAILSVQDPRERPADRQSEADSAHAAWVDPESDFFTILNMWNAVHAASTSRSQRNRFCRSHFLHPRRVDEWINLVDDLRATCVRHRWKLPGSLGEMEVADRDGVHRSILAGIPRSIGEREDAGHFRAPNGKRFRIFPGSGLASKPPRWVMGVNLVETSFLFSRENAAIRPDWLEQVAPHLCSVRYERPQWNPERGFVEAEERVQLGQLTLRHGTLRHYGSVDPAACRALFLEDGLLPANLNIRHPSLKRYRALLASLERWENKLRRPGYFTDSRALLEELDRRIPADVFTAKAFQTWCGQNDWVPSVGDLLAGESLNESDYPDELKLDGLTLPLEYHYCPDQPELDGVCLRAREEDLGALPPELMEWTLPAWLPEKVELLIRSLDKRLRTRCQPYARTAQEAIDWFRSENFLYTHSLYQALASFLAAKLDCILAAPDLNPDTLPGRLHFSLRVIDRDGNERFYGNQPPPEKERTAAAKRSAAQPDPTAQAGYWKQRFEREQNDLIQWVQKKLPLPTSVQLDLATLPSAGENAFQDFIDGIVLEALGLPDRLPESEAEFDERCKSARMELADLAENRAGDLKEIFALRSEVREALEALTAGEIHQDIDLQFSTLLAPGWCGDPLKLSRMPAYLRGILLRIERCRLDPAKDRRKAADLEPAYDALAQKTSSLTSDQLRDAFLKLEELRLHLFAPECRPHEKMSLQRFTRWLEKTG